MTILESESALMNANQSQDCRDLELARERFPEFTAEDAEVSRGKFWRSLRPLRSSAPSAVNPLENFRELVSDQILNIPDLCGELDS